MALKSLVRTLDSLDEAVRDLYVAGEGDLDGWYVLDVDAIDGYGIANVQKLQRGLDKERKAARNAEAERKKLEQAKTDLEQQLEAAGKGGGGGGDDLKTAREKWEADLQKRIDAALTEERTAHEGTQSKATTYEGQLRQLLVDDAITKHLTTGDGPKASPRLFGPLLRQFVRAETDDDGSFKVIVTDAKGEKKIVSVRGETREQTIPELIAEMAKDEEFSTYFAAPAKTGTGGGAAGGGGETRPRPTGGKDIWLDANSRDPRAYAEAKERAAKQGGTVRFRE